MNVSQDFKPKPGKSQSKCGKTAVFYPDEIDGTLIFN